ncbi:hypothetical protein Tco_0125723, partial [Tanacetum coccineum]
QTSASRVGPGCLAAPAAELSPILNLGAGVVKQALFRGGISASGTSQRRPLGGDAAAALIRIPAAL